MFVSKKSKVRIQGHLGNDELLAQLAEECAELGHAALKLRRTLSDKNPTPVSSCAARESLFEEVSDVLFLLDLCGVDVTDPEIDLTQERKAARWIKRLEGDKYAQ